MIPKQIPVAIQSDGAQLVAVLHQADSKKIVILCHGFTGNKCEDRRLFVEAAREIQIQGHNALRFDFYGSGDSEGDFADTRISTNIQNLHDVIQWAREQGFEHIAILGISMGAATAILTVTTEPVDVLILWSSVPSTKDLIFQHVGVSQHDVAEKSIYEYDGWEIKKEFATDALGFDIQKELAAITIPKLILQGTADAPLFTRGFEEFRDCVRPPADFMHIMDAGHTYQNPHHRRQVIRQTVIWLNRNF